MECLNYGTKSMDAMVQTNAATVCKCGGAVVESDLNRTRRDNREVGSRCGAKCTRVENDDLGGFLYSFGFRVVKDHRYQVKCFFNSKSLLSFDRLD